MNLVAAVPIYLLIPVCGPQAAFPDFPSVLPQVTAHPILLMAVPNCIPSVHTYSALLVAWYLRRWAVGKVFGVAYLVLMIAATLASGQHYLFRPVRRLALCGRSVLAGWTKSHPTQSTWRRQPGLRSYTGCES